MDTVTFVLNTWQRPHTLKEQTEAITKQTIKPNEIMIWQNQQQETLNIIKKCLVANYVYYNTK